MVHLIHGGDNIYPPESNVQVHYLFAYRLYVPAELIISERAFFYIKKRPTVVSLCTSDVVPGASR